jgi:PAS domain S-box-containing protein
MLQSLRDKVRSCYQRWSPSHRFDPKAVPSSGANSPVRGHEADLQAIFANTPFLLTRCSSDLRYLFVSEAYARMLGRHPEEFAGRSIVDIMGEEGFQTILPHVERVLRGEAVEYESDVNFAGVGPRQLLVKYTPDRDRSGNVRGWVASIVDLTDQKKAARMAADLKAMTVLREMGSLYVRKGLELDECLERTMDAAITIVGADKGSIQLFDASSNSLVIAAHHGFAEPFLTFFKQVRDDAGACGRALRTKAPAIVEDVLESDIFVGDESQAILINARVRAVVSMPLLSSNATPMGMISTHYAIPHRPTERELYLLEVLARQAADYLERKRMELRLAERESQLAMFVEHAPVGIVMFDDKMRFLAVSRRFLSDHELGDPAGVIGRSVYEILPDLPLRWWKIHVRVLAGEELAHEEDFFPRKDGCVYWVRWSMKPWRTADGRIGGALLYAEMINEKVEARRALANSEERFRSSLLHSPLPVLSFDDQERILALSESWLDQTGYSREELRRIEDWTARAFGEHSGEVLERIRQIISTEPEAERDEQIIRTKDGRDRIWGFVTSAVGTQSDGRRLFVCVAQDLTDSKAHEEHIRLLLREVNHRSKNMLSVVQAIARQTAAREPKDFIGRFAERIQALAANQDLLVRNAWRGVEIEDLVRAQLAPFADLIGSRIVVRGPELRLNAAAAQAIGLTLHELATNAGKYGALSTGRGRVDVCWGTDGDILSMSWTERDGPPAAPPERRGFGTTVITSMAKATVSGEVHLDYGPSGLVWQLTCPAGNGLEPRK